MTITDVLAPRLPPLRRRSSLLLSLLALVALAGIPAYQAYHGAFGGSVGSSTGVFGPRVTVELERAEIATGDVLRGELVITAPDGADVVSPAVITLYPAHVAMTETNRLAETDVDVPQSITAGDAVRVPFTLDVSSGTKGTYTLNVDLSAKISKGTFHSTVRTAGTTAFTIR